MEYNNRRAINAAKANIEKHYSVVGVLEMMEDSIKVFEASLPQFFKGAMNAYKNIMGI